MPGLALEGGEHVGRAEFDEMFLIHQQFGFFLQLGTVMERFAKHYRGFAYGSRDRGIHMMQAWKDWRGRCR
jgi:hypothetical protein